MKLKYRVIERFKQKYPVKKGKAYLCAVIDLCGKAVLSWRIGTEKTSSPVIDTITEALRQEKGH